MDKSFALADVTVVTVSFNSSGLLPKLIESLPADVNVVIVDNAGQDGEALDALAQPGRIRIFRNNKNEGFGNACNFGVKQVETEFVFLLNPDIIVHEGAIEALLETVKRHQLPAAYNPRISNADGTPYFKRRSVLLPRKEWLPRGWPDGETQVPVLSGSAIFASQRLLLRFQFDPQIFMYHEDDDLSLRMREAGIKLYFIPDAHVTHAAGTSSGKNPEVVRFKAFHLGKSRVNALKTYERPFPRIRSNLRAIAQLLSPENLTSPQRRAKNLGFFEGVRKPAKRYTHPSEMVRKSSRLPWWKIKREVTRLFNQILAVPRGIYNYFFATLFYDVFQAKNIHVFDGQVPQAGKIAVYLIFPSRGLLESHKRSLEHIRAAGYAPLVVSNLPISEEDADYLREVSWRYILRPNIGYDFGGYREGFLTLRPLLGTLERLVFLNDSSWFPLPETDNWLLEAEKQDLDYVGAATSFGIPKVARDRYETIKWDFDPTLSEFHYCSYAISVGPRILQDKRYTRFWKGYQLTEKKNKVVRYGEMGMSRFAIDKGFSHGATYDIRTLPDTLNGCTDDELNYYARNMIYLNEWIMKQVLDSTLPYLDARQSPAARDEVIKLILATVARFGVSYVVPELLWEKHRFPFLKKSPVGNNKHESDVMYDLACRFDGIDGEIIRKEMEDTRRAKGLLDAQDTTG
ncbi:glycosyltransferase [Chachezhania antarctica]|uniref:glycosyltransferase n=1 Tax=Chachezhania antarctica TaxID=2340860 RepID=UPI000EAD0403|nr:glycosyltransferase [Chachezhania antarctica]